VSWLLAKKISCFFLIFLILSLSFYPAFAQEPVVGSMQDEEDEKEADAEAVAGEDEDLPAEPTVERVSFYCHSPSTNPEEKVLDPKEVEKLKRELNIDGNGFQGREIPSVEPADEDRETLGNPQAAVVIPTGRGNEAQLKEIPNKKFKPEEMQHFTSKFVKGPFAAGLSLYDTLRVGRCQDPEKMEAAGIPCPVTEGELALRNSGEGIVEDFKLVGKDFKNIYGELKEFVSGEEPVEGLTKEQTDALRLNMGNETDLNKLRANAFKRDTSTLIPNHIKTDTFNVSMGSACNGNDCLISSYSMFDKYFNSWFAADLVVSNFGPTLFGQAKRYLGHATRRGWPWKLNETALFTKMRRTLADPESWFGQIRTQRMLTRARKFGLGKDFWDKMMTNANWDSGYKAVKGTSFKKWLSEATAPNGFLDGIKDPVRRGELFKLAKDLRGYSRVQRDIMNQTDDVMEIAMKKFGMGSAEANHAMIESARSNFRLMNYMDNSVYLDAPEWWLRDPFANMYPYAVKNTHANSIVTLTSDSKHIDSIGMYFSNKGDFGGLATSGAKAYETTADGALQLYRIDDNARFIDTVNIEDLKKHFTRWRQKAVKTEKGEWLLLDETNLDLISGGSAGIGKVEVYEAGWAKAHSLTPEEFAAKLTHSRVKGRFASNFNENMESLYDTLVEKNFSGMSRKYYSALDRSLAHEEEILKSYFSSIGGAAKWTVAPYVYWGAKRGFGQEGLSAYMLPDEWSELEFYLGDVELYNDAFVDFFAQHGSDEGDIFRQVLNKLPWKMVLNAISDKFSPVKETFDSWTGRGWRAKVENIAYFTSTGDECAGCTADLLLSTPDIAKTGQGELELRFNALKNIDSFILEDALTKEAREEGSTLIAFGHHTNVRGKVVEGAESEETDLFQAQKDGETCADKVRDAGFGWVGENPARIGAMMAITESLSYVMFGMSGMIFSVAQQVLWAPQFQNCADDREGYFMHIFAPAEENQETQVSGSQKASEKATDIIRNVNDNLFGKSENDDDDSAFAQGQRYVVGAERPEDEEKIEERYDIDKIGQQDRPEAQSQGFIEAITDRVKNTMQNLEDKQRSNTLLQITVATKGATDGDLYARELFFFWFKGETNVSKYDTQTKTLIVDPETDIKLEIDTEAGKILVNDKPVITSKDHVRLTAPNGNIPAYEVPQRIGQIGLPTNSKAPLFEMSITGEFTVLEPEVLNCITQNVEEQTGVGMITGNITEAFGEVEAIRTTTHNVSTDSINNLIVATGSPRRIAHGSSARAIILANMQTNLANGEDAPVGQMQSVQFKNGVIIYKPETHELLVWLKRHSKAIGKKSDIEGLNATPTTVKNPETDCPEPAINLEALPIPGSPAIEERVGNLNDSLEKMGPFQVFDTDKYRFLFYSEMLEDGTCEDRVKIINKETGEVYDQPIVGPIENTPDGIKFKTADGKEHTLDFNADDGTPTLSYNGQAPEVLRTAQGPNGSFWYDPNTGHWYPENAQLIPLIEAFKQNGFNTAVGADGRVSTNPSGNNLSVQIGSGDSMPFNLPSLPENPVAMFLFIASLLAVIMVARNGIERGKSLDRA